MRDKCLVCGKRHNLLMTHPEFTIYWQPCSYYFHLANNILFSLYLYWSTEYSFGAGIMIHDLSRSEYIFKCHIEFFRVKFYFNFLINIFKYARNSK